MKNLLLIMKTMEKEFKNLNVENLKGIYSFDVSSLQPSIPLDSEIVDLDCLFPDTNAIPQANEIKVPGSWCLAQRWEEITSRLQHQLIYMSDCETLSNETTILYRNNEQENVEKISNRLNQYWYNKIKLYESSFSIEAIMDGYYLLQVLTDAPTATYDIVHSSEIRDRYTFEWVKHAVYGMIYLLHEINSGDCGSSRPAKFVYILHIELCESKLNDIMQDISTNSLEVLKRLRVQLQAEQTAQKWAIDDDFGLSELSTYAIFNDTDSDDETNSLEVKLSYYLTATRELLDRIQERRDCNIDGLQTKYVQKLHKLGKVINIIDKTQLIDEINLNFLKNTFRNIIDFSKNFLKSDKI